MKGKFLAKKYLSDSSNPMSESSGLACKFHDIIDLSLGDPDIITDKYIIEESYKDVKKGYTRYSDPKGDPELIEELIKFYDESYKINYKPGEIMITVGACHGMYLALLSVLNFGNEVIVHSPFFTPYKEQIEMAGGKLVELETCEEDEFDINIDKLSNLINSKTKAIILNSPNNPTGACFSKELINKIAKIAVENDLIVISDDVYDGFTYDSEFYPISSASGMKERTITLGSFSKDFCMTGWRVGYALAPDYIIETMRNINEGICFSAPTVSQRAAVYGMRHRESIVPQIRDEFKSRMEYAYTQIKSLPYVSAVKPKAGIYIFMNIKGTGISSKGFCEKLLKEAHVLALPGTAFGKYGEGYIRMACTVNIDKLTEAFERIRVCLLNSNRD